MLITSSSSPAILDRKYQAIRNEALKSGILLKETDEKVEEVITNTHILNAKANAVRTGAFAIHSNLLKSDKLAKLCQLSLILLTLSGAVIIIVKLIINQKTVEHTRIVEPAHSLFQTSEERT
ncbi:unnamed protein product, partial [Didymodactylos carnosus]